jgi:CDP-paratose 2-epimerase
MGGSRHSNCSMLEAIQLTEELSGRKLNYTMSETARSGDHIWWISDVRKFQQDYPDWAYQYDLRKILEEIVAATHERMSV